MITVQLFNFNFLLFNLPLLCILDIAIKWVFHLMQLMVLIRLLRVSACLRLFTFEEHVMKITFRNHF